MAALVKEHLSRMRLMKMAALPRALSGSEESWRAIGKRLRITRPDVRGVPSGSASD